MDITRFYFQKAVPALEQRTRLKLFIERLFKLEKTKLKSLTYIFCDDKYLHSINKRFLDHDTYTDIISFNLSSPGEAVEGEIYISIDRIRENALSFGTSIKNELHRVIFHGALHLCGYLDKQHRDKVLMTAMEDKYLKKYFNS